MKPLHIFALLLILVSLTFYIAYPVYLFAASQSVTPSQELQDILDKIPLGEVYILIAELIFAFVLLILIPLLWYVVVNSISFRKAISRIRITTENIDIAFLWGILAAILIYVIIFVLSFILQILGVSSTDLSNVTDLDFLSPPVLFVLVAVIPVAEEIFFRGFLLEKIESFAGQNIAIVTTSILFGIAHMGYGKIFPVIMPMIMGLLLAYIVIKTKNLFASIFAHVTFNVTVIIIYFLFDTLI
jgi:membrane protease YdiL (CAAX protease family)